MGHTHIAEMPGLMSDSRNRFFSRRVPLHKAVRRRPAAERSGHSVIGKVRADKIQILPLHPQIDGQPGLVFAVSRDRHIGPGKRKAIVVNGLVPDGLLLLPGPPAG